MSRVAGLPARAAGGRIEGAIGSRKRPLPGRVRGAVRWANRRQASRYGRPQGRRRTMTQIGTPGTPPLTPPQLPAYQLLPGESPDILVDVADVVPIPGW